MKLENVCITLTGINITVAPEDGDGRYTNLDRTTSAQKSDGTNPTQAEIDAPTNSIGYVKAANDSALCGFTDWRLPTLKELEVMYRHRKVLGMVRGWYWSSSPYVDDSSFAWVVGFGSGGVYYGSRYDYGRVRLVRDVPDTDSYLQKKARERAEAGDREYASWMACFYAEIQKKAQEQAREELEQRERSKKLMEKIHGADWLQRLTRPGGQHER